MRFQTHDERCLNVQNASIVNDEIHYEYDEMNIIIISIVVNLVISNNSKYHLC